MSERGQDRRRGGFLRVLAVVLGGIALGLTWQPYGAWPLLLIGIPILTLAVRGQPARRSFGLGYLYGLAMLTVSISWLQVLGAWVAGLLILFEALFFGLLAVGLSLVGRWRWWPLAAAGGWVAMEFAYARVPFGGFGWTRIAYAAVDTPAGRLLPDHRRRRSLLRSGPGRPASRLGDRQRPLGSPHADPGPGRGARGSHSGRAGGRPSALPGRARRNRRQCPGRHRAGQHPGSRRRSAGPGALGDQQPPVGDHRPDDPGPARAVTGAGLLVVAGELHRHRSARRPADPADRSGGGWRWPIGRSWSVRCSTGRARTSGRPPASGGIPPRACWPATPSATWCRSENGSRSAGSCCRWFRSSRRSGPKACPGRSRGC